MDKFVAYHLKGVSRTYAIVIPMLPNGLADAVGLAYLLMRIVDTLEDSTEISDERRIGLLSALDQSLAGGESEVPASVAQPLGELAAERELMRFVPDVLGRIGGLDPVFRNASRACARKMIAGVLMMLDRSDERNTPYPAIRDADELRTYCYYVAGVVGEMLCEMMAHYLKTPALLRLRELAIELGVGLQLVNILKDSVTDSKHGRRYLPTAADGTVSHTQVYRAALEEARTSLEKGVQFVLALPSAARGLRSFCGLPIVWGALTLSRAERDTRKAKIDRGVILATIERFGRLAGDDAALPRWLKGLIRPAPRATAVG